MRFKKNGKTLTEKRHCTDCNAIFLTTGDEQQCARHRATQEDQGR